jgi:hypothetical protein
MKVLKQYLDGTETVPSRKKISFVGAGFSGFKGVFFDTHFLTLREWLARVYFSFASCITNLNRRIYFPGHSPAFYYGFKSRRLKPDRDCNSVTGSLNAFGEGVLLFP